MFLLISSSVMHPFNDCLYTYSCNYSTLQVLSLCLTGLGPIDKLHGAMRKRHARAANLATQRNVHWHGHCMHACTRVTIAPAYTKLANSSAARSVLPTTIHSRLTAISHTGRCLSGFILAIAVLAITSRLGIRVAAQNMSSTLQLALSLRVVARCGARRWLTH